ncbi:class I SAM-dependent methyltransferase [Solibacillus silvestris]|uniref:class I SAM-dependent methyltransferase n=1 Tax=Solibacillus silvestris TaxID=76853 RepID=UPI003F8003E5
MKQNIYDNEQFFKGYEEIRNRKFNYNNLLERPNFLALIPDLHGKVILDVGCGKGDFANDCMEKGALQVDGIDISRNMIAAAKRNYKKERLHFQQAAIEDFVLSDRQYDIICSSLVLHYVADFEAVIEKISNAMRPNGIFLFSIEHPISTANKGKEQWIKDEAGELSHFVVDRYQHEGERSQHWLVDNVVMYHRSMATIVNTLIGSNLQIEKIIEPVPTNEAIEYLPTLQKEHRRPSFLIMRARKSN